MVEAKIPSYLVSSLAIGTPEEVQKQRRLNTLLRDAALPRQIRVRNAKVPVGQKKRSPESPKTPPSPNQDMAVSTFTKRAALGPWAGPYDSHPDALLPSSTLYLDEAGVTYCSLSGTSDTTARLPLAEVEHATIEPPRLVAEATKGLVAPRPWPSRSRAAVPRQSGKTWQSGRLSSSAVRRNGAINQPRKS